ncbi:class I SAM-dependent methyltransferase [Streptomyces sp. ST2-7A]|uniref:class I SAM-dependent methyltransferase n=1 Tax=Streptomyces sp. ST2-7A TaxID=2907214 RepID=UPI001F46D31C|nr:class I SAM-dependent methyltransferase [Streptomyces sp. ST2-7A]MCE7079484.1 class I SAM-dependent methyltransferase [Streptomyces sp. ST2-7A]
MIATPPSSVATLVNRYLEGPPRSVPDAFRTLTASVWSPRGAVEGATAAVPLLIEGLRRAEPGRRGRLAILLGLLAESEYPSTDGPLVTAVRSHLDLYLELVRAERGTTPTGLALGYLLGHFPADRDAVLKAVEGLELSPEDLSRLHRCLAELDLERPDLGRVWPAPSVWSLTEEERAFDRRWIGELDGERIAAAWENDTRTVFGCVGARAYWAVCHGLPVDAPPATVPDRSLARAAEAGPAILAPHASLLRCPSCGIAALEPDEAVLRCGRCRATRPVAGGIADLTSSLEEAGVGDFLERLSRVPSMGLFYETVARPNFLRVSGSNWGAVVTPDDEDRYLADHVRPVDGPVVDLAAGAGRWTAVLADRIGEDRLIAVDSSLPMLSVLRGRLPGVPALLAAADDLPFEDGSVGAVVCWNALQAFYDDAEAAIAEVGRILRPGGSFTLLTFRRSPDPVYGYFQFAHRFPQHENGLRLFDPADLRRWLAAAGLRLCHEAGPGTFVFMSAVRES